MAETRFIAAIWVTNQKLSHWFRLFRGQGRFIFDLSKFNDFSPIIIKIILLTIAPLPLHKPDYPKMGVIDRIYPVAAVLNSVVLPDL